MATTINKKQDHTFAIQTNVYMNQLCSHFIINPNDRDENQIYKNGERNSMTFCQCSACEYSCTHVLGEDTKV